MSWPRGRETISQLGPKTPEPHKEKLKVEFQ